MIRGLTFDQGKHKTGLIIAAGILMAILISVVGAILFACLLEKGSADISFINLFAHSIRLLSVSISCLLVALLTKEKKVLSVLCVAAGYTIVLLLWSLLTAERPLCGAVPGMLSIIVGTGISCAFCIRGKSDKRLIKRAYG